MKKFEYIGRRIARQFPLEVQNFRVSRRVLWDLWGVCKGKDWGVSESIDF